MKKVNLIFEIKSMGIVFFIPIFLCLFSIIYGFRVCSYSDVYTITPLIESLEVIIGPSLAFWIIFLFYDYYENKGFELLFSYPLKVYHHLYLRVFTFIALFIFLISPIFLFGLFTDGFKNTLLLFFQIGPQIFLISAISLFLVVTFKNIGIPITIIASYISIEYLTKGSFMPWYHISFFNTNFLRLEDLFTKSITNLILSLVFFYFSYFIFTKYKLKN